MKKSFYLLPLLTLLLFSYSYADNVNVIKKAVILLIWKANPLRQIAV